MALLIAAGSASALPIESFTYETAEAGGAGILRAGGHPDQVVATFNFPKDAEGVPLASARNVEVDLPLGAVGIPTAVPNCTEEQLSRSQCPLESQVGYAVLSQSRFPVPVYFPIFNMVAQPGTLAQFGLYAANQPIHLVARVHSQPEYGVTITVRNTPQPLPLTAIKTVFWGVPADESHDGYRGDWAGGGCLGITGPTGNKCPSHPEKVLPFLINPSACTPTSPVLGRVDYWPEPDIFAQASADTTDAAGEPVAVGGCAVVPFSPSLEVRPTTGTADSPSGLDVNLRLPVQEPLSVSEAQLRDATLALPAGMTVNPASAAGLGGCTAAQVGLLSPVGQPVAHFDEHAITCPASSKLGTVELLTPVLPNPLHGGIYLASPHQNPFGSLLALYLVVEDPKTGALIKIPGEVAPDPQTGSLTVTFPHNPQLPFEDLKVALYKGARAALKTPLVCGDFTTTSTMVPWTAPEGRTMHPSDAFTISKTANGSACPSSEAGAPNHPSFSAGTVNPAAGAFSPFVLQVSREDGSQPIKGLETTLPKGLLGRLAGVPYCPDAALAAAAGKSGVAEQSSPSCPAGSQVGTVQVAAGAGSEPLHVSGKAYLAGPYKGAPLSLAIVTPAVAGPFDLGTVVVRNALQVDPLTTQIHVVSDPIPTILQGIPLDIRQISVSIDRPSFTLNPTACEPAQITGSTLSAFDQSASLIDRFQVGGCDALAFKPKLRLAFGGQTKRIGHPAVRAVLTAPPGGANIAATTVVLPRSEFIDQAHVNGPCTRVQFGEGACPAGSILGTARAWSPLLEKPLEGYVYFRSNGGERKLPDIVADLHGQINVDLVGFIDSVKVGKESSRVRTRFLSVPDAPVSRFELRLRGGKRGLIQNSEDLCKIRPTAVVQMTGQNGRIADSKTPIARACKKAKHHRRKAHHHKKKTGH